MAAAQKIHISLRALQHYEAGTRIPPLDVVEQMMELYHCPIDAFISKKT